MLRPRISDPHMLILAVKQSEFIDSVSRVRADF